MKKQLISLCLAALVTACATQQAHREGLAAIDSGQYESGIAKLEQATNAEPGNAGYQIDLKGRREEAVRQLIAAGDRARVGGAAAEAETTYKRVLAIEPANARALRGLELLARDVRHTDSIAQATRELAQGRIEEADARVRAVLAEDPGSASAVALRAKIEATRGPQSVTPRLRSRDNRPVTLQFRDASTKMVFEVLARQTGINFIFDKDVKSDGKTTIFVQNVPVEQAIDLILGQNQLARQVLSDSMAMIYPNTTAKQREYQDQIVRTFYVTNTDPKKTMDMLKTMLGAKTLFVDERANAVVVRDTPELIRMAERLIAAVDLPEAEVMMEVEVLEISRNKLQQLGIRYPEGATISPTALAGDPLVLADLKAQDSTTLQVTDLPVSIDLKKNVGVSSVLASPRIRARSREKAKILIGQRVPVITTSTVLTTGGNGTSSNVQYVDVGLTLEVEPTVYMDSDVAIKINLEVSNIISSVTVGDSLAYQIGTRNASTLLRLKDGETQILAGLINDQDRRSSSRIPGLGDVPLLGRLFSTNKTDTEKTEIVLSITPRIIRTQPRPTSDNTEFYFGTESSLRSSPLAMSSSNAVAAVAAASAATTVAIAPDAAEAPAADAAADAPVETASADPADQPRERPVLTWEGPAEVKVGQEFDVSLNLSSTAELTNVRSMVRFDPAVFELQRASAGNILSADAGAAIAPVINQRSGRAQFDVTGTPVSGSGSLLNLHFKAISPRPASMITVQQFAANGADGSAVPTIAPRPVTVVVKQ